MNALLSGFMFWGAVMLFRYPSMSCLGESNMQCSGGVYLLGRSSMLLDVVVTTCRYLTIYQYLLTVTWCPPFLLCCFILIFLYLGHDCKLRIHICNVNFIDPNSLSHGINGGSWPHQWLFTMSSSTKTWMNTTCILEMVYNCHSTYACYRACLLLYFNAYMYY